MAHTPQSNTTQLPRRIVILGGGFAGVYTAKHLLKRCRRLPAEQQYEVHLVSRENYMVFQPMLAEVLSGSVGIADTVSPLRRLAPGAILHVCDIERIDLAGNKVVCLPGVRGRALELEFDHLVIALGNVTDFRGMTGIAEHAMSFKTLGDAITLRNHVLRLLEEAEAEPDAQFRRQMLTFVAAGGGFSGVEAIAELQDFVRRAVRQFRRFTLRDCRFILVHSHGRILPEMNESLATYAQKVLEKRGIEMVLNTRLVSATASEAVLKDGQRIANRTLICTVPSHPNPVVAALDTSLKPVGGMDDRGKLLVDSTCLVNGMRNVWALGDCAMVPLLDRASDSAVRYAPPTAQHAIREADVCAHNIVASITGGASRHFNFPGLGSLAAIGGRRGVAQMMGVRVSGFLAWVLWRAVYWIKMPGFSTKLRVAFSWFLDLFMAPALVQLRLISRAGIRNEHFEAGQIIFEQGDFGDCVYVVVSGQAQVERQEPDGTTTPLAVRGPGEYFGEVAVVHKSPRTATVRCLTPMDLLAIDRRDFGKLIAYLSELRQSVERSVKEREPAAKPES